MRECGGSLIDSPAFVRGGSEQRAMMVITIGNVKYGLDSFRCEEGLIRAVTAVSFLLTTRARACLLFPVPDFFILEPRPWTRRVMARLRFGTDSLGKEILELVPAAPAAAASPPSRLQDGNGHDAAVEENKPYKGDNTIVMMEWERPYMRALVDALGITGESDVLEIGFGCGYSADRIQEFSPRSHTVVEPDPIVLDRLKGWAEGRPGVRVVEGFWQTVLPALGRYDAVFFDDFPLPGTPDSSDLRGPMSRWHAFIDLCVAHHLPVGGRITGYLARPIPVERPGCEAAPLVAFPVDVPDNCPYFPYGEAYIPLIMRVERPGAGTGDGDGAGGIARGAGGDSRRSPLLSDASGDDAGLPRKRRKRLVLEALVRESLGLGADRM